VAVQQPRVKDLDEVMLRAIDEGLSSAVGETGARALYYHFEAYTNLRREDVLKKPEAFVGFLRSVFGAGSKILERMIIQKLCSRFGIGLQEINTDDLAVVIESLKMMTRSDKRRTGRVTNIFST